MFNLRILRAFYLTGISWDREFNAQELQHIVSAPAVTQQLNEPAQKQTHHRPDGEADELARTAGMLLENVRHEQNPKFQKSQFLELMKQLRDGEVIVEGNQMVESEGRTSSQAQVDVKGKGRAVPIVARPMNLSANETTWQPSLSSQNQTALNQEQEMKDRVQEDANDAYFRQENAEFTRYWTDTQVKQEPAGTAETQSWGKLQADWDQFEATTSGIKVITNYQFQENNPYLLGDSSRTRAHLLHMQGRQSVLEVRFVSLSPQNIIQRLDRKSLI